MRRKICVSASFVFTTYYCSYATRGELPRPSQQALLPPVEGRAETDDGPCKQQPEKQTGCAETKLLK